jgi:hypothetical protein
MTSIHGWSSSDPRGTTPILSANPQKESSLSEKYISLDSGELF